MLFGGEYYTSQRHNMGARPNMPRHYVGGLSLIHDGMVVTQLWYNDDTVIA